MLRGAPVSKVDDVTQNEYQCDTTLNMPRDRPVFNPELETSFQVQISRGVSDVLQPGHNTRGRDRDPRVVHKNRSVNLQVPRGMFCKITAKHAMFSHN